MSYVINPSNVEAVLADIQTRCQESQDKLFNFDFSGTDFSVLAEQDISRLFVVLSHLSQPFTLKLNDCVFSENRQSLETVKLGLATTQQIKTMEFKRCILSEETLLDMITSMIKNSAIENLYLDGIRLTLGGAVMVTPNSVCKLLADHPTRFAILTLDGLVKGKQERHAFFNPQAEVESKSESTKDHPQVPPSLKRK